MIAHSHDHAVGPRAPFAGKKLTRRAAEVIDRAQMVRALKLAIPKITLSEIADRTGIPQDRVKYYLGYRWKNAPLRSPWIAPLFAACAALAYGERAAAAEKFREVAGKLEAP